MPDIVFSLRIPREIYQEIQVYADSNFYSINTYILLAIQKLANEHRHNREILSGTKSVQVEPGLEALKVKRGKDGKYQKVNKDGE